MADVPKKPKRPSTAKPWYCTQRDAWRSPWPGSRTLRDREGQVIRGRDNREQATAVWHDTLQRERPPGAVETAGDLFEQWLAYQRLRGVPETTVSGFEAAWAAFADHCRVIGAR